ncbi:acid resistance repetitive basic protein Asr [Yersinia similis]|uniref:Acid shock protein n=1 Tax=Yersinia similis TaxID=367190 RepID=A0A0T9PIT2_9GAMM|nr:acid resistance repetitive basic protein Asr [Yersinia similis]AHK21337.1 acid-shock protein [Yersinia similis]CFQ53327.1 acid shock protein [Yersinia similis]CNB54726.1 acid shock protein [Yersinia similis]CNE47426.1 acid shock protein [Yersinia similis]CNE95345.1 acid shock protein [Yersinia similis]
MKTVLALIVAATLSLSSVAFAADTVAPQATPMATAPAVHSASAKTMYHKKVQKPNAIKNTNKTAPGQKAQAAKKHHKAAHSHKAPTVAPAIK